MVCPAEEMHIALTVGIKTLAAVIKFPENDWYTFSDKHYVDDIVLTFLSAEKYFL